MLLHRHILNYTVRVICLQTIFLSNSIDIESTLFGIGANNLVNPKPPTVAQFKTITNS